MSLQENFTPTTAAIEQKKGDLEHNDTLKQIKIIPLPGTEELAKKIAGHLNSYIYHEDKNEDSNLLIFPKYTRFSDGDGKMEIEKGPENNICNKLLFILSDPYNYSETYEFRGEQIPTTPDEHMQNVLRAINATSGKEAGTYVIQPLRYQGRQDKRNGLDESLDLAIGLNNLNNNCRNLRRVITVDAHNHAAFQNCLPQINCINAHPTVPILQEVIDKIPEELHNILIIGPDEGAAQRARRFADLLDHSPHNNFVKRRSYTKKDTILEHKYNGDPKEVEGKCIIIPDDLIASGTTILKVAKQAKEMGAKKIILIASHATFTRGVEPFDEAFQEGYLDMLYTTNLSFIPEAIQNREWYREVDCSNMLADIIRCLGIGDERVSTMTEEKEKTLLEKIKTIKQNTPTQTP